MIMTSVIKSDIARARSLLISVGHSACNVRTVVQRAVKLLPQENMNQRKNPVAHTITTATTTRDVIAKADLDCPVMNMRRKKNTKLSFVKPMDRICMRKNAHSSFEDDCISKEDTE